MSREFRFQDPGEGIHEAEVVEVAVAAGDRVEDGDTVLVVETDKATTDVPSPYSGEVAEVAVGNGDSIRVGDLLMRFAGDGDTQEAGTEQDREAGKAEPAQGGGPARQTADEGKGKREAEAEAEAETEGQPEPEPEPEREGEGEPRGSVAAGGQVEEAVAHDEALPVPAAPSTRRLARELGVELREVEGSGPGGRVLAEDVQSAAGTEAGAVPEREREAGPEERREAGAQEKRREEEPASALPDFSRWGEIERIPLRSVRRATARAMARAWSEIPHVMHHERVDITELEAFRQAQADRVEARGGHLTLTVLAMKAAVAALREFPRFNASLDSGRDEIVLKHHYHLGVAVATERGLLVPVVRDVDRKGVAELAVELAELAGRARKGEVERADMEGGTFTLTNVGSIGGTLFTPIVYHPQVAILGLARASWQPVVQGGARGRIEPRLLLPLCLAFDHRVVDGAEAARFANHLAASLQDPQALLLAL
jgi:pyruvate dehydrogenase E2 component (dihydrolipoamide acetyltransferase)